MMSAQLVNWRSSSLLSWLGVCLRITCWWQSETLLANLAPCRSASRVSIEFSTQRIVAGQKKDKERIRQAVRCFCCRHALLQSGGRLASISDAVSLSLSPHLRVLAHSRLLSCYCVVSPALSCSLSLHHSSACSLPRPLFPCSFLACALLLALFLLLCNALAC